jgi:putative salt-induced outer membrane protein YdiY
METASMSYANFKYMYDSLENLEMTQEMYLAFLEVKNLLTQTLDLENDTELCLALIIMSSVMAKELADKNG